jgi:hypothetical protein
MSYELPNCPLLTIEMQRQLFADCKYDFESRRVEVRGMKLDRKRFNIVFGGYVFIMDRENDRMSRNAWNAYMNMLANRWIVE